MSNGEMNIQSNSNQLDYYRIGVSFFKASDRCYGEKIENTYYIIKNADQGSVFTQLPAPTVVNAAFACEMFFKSLLINSNIIIPKGRDGHNLFKLYKRLPLSIQDQISDFCYHGSKKDSFEVFLEDHANDFADIRYFIENKGFTNMSPMKMHALAFNLMQITKAILSSRGNNEQLSNS